jgi:hydrogenase expression/formation protein HypC
MRLEAIDGSDGVAEMDGVRREVNLLLLDEEVRVGEYVLVHAGFAISRLDEAEARETLALMWGGRLPGNMA